MNRQRVTLFIVVLLLIAAVIWSFRATPRPKTVSKLTYAPGQRAARAVMPARSSSRSSDNGRVLKITLLDQSQAGFKGYRRNIFKPIFVDEYKLLQQKAAAFKAPRPLPPVLPRPLPLPIPVQPAAQPDVAPLARFTFLGFLKKDGHKTIFLAKDKDILLVKTGETIAGRYTATAITDLALTLTVTDTGDEIVIPLLENRPLAAAR